MDERTLHCKILGVTTNASETEIKRAYRELAHLIHPDKNQNSNSAKQKFQQLKESYEYLTRKGGAGNSSGPGSQEDAKAWEQKQETRDSASNNQRRGPGLKIDRDGVIYDPENSSADMSSSKGPTEQSTDSVAKGKMGNGPTLGGVVILTVLLAMGYFGIYSNVAGTLNSRIGLKGTDIEFFDHSSTMAMAGLGALILTIIWFRVVMNFSTKYLNKN